MDVPHDILTYAFDHLNIDCTLKFVDDKLNSITSNWMEEALPAVRKSCCAVDDEFETQYESALSTIEENRIRISEQEKDIVLKCDELARDDENLSQDLRHLRKEADETRRQLTIARAEFNEMEKNNEYLTRERNKTILALEKTLKSFAVAIAWYKRYMGVHLSWEDGAKHKCVLYVTDPATSSKLAVNVYSDKEGLYIIRDDGSVLRDPKKILRHLCQVRRQWIETF